MSRIQPVSKGYCQQSVALCTTRMALGACDPLFLQDPLLPSDGSGADPHATLLVVQPVAQTGQRRAGEWRRWSRCSRRRGAQHNCWRRTGPLPCHILLLLLLLLSPSPPPWSGASGLSKHGLAAAALM